MEAPAKEAARPVPAPVKESILPPVNDRRTTQENVQTNNLPPVKPDPTKCEACGGHTDPGVMNVAWLDALSLLKDRKYDEAYQHVF